VTAVFAPASDEDGGHQPGPRNRLRCVLFPLYPGSLVPWSGLAHAYQPWPGDFADCAPVWRSAVIPVGPPAWFPRPAALFLLAVA